MERERGATQWVVKNTKTDLAQFIKAVALQMIMKCTI